MRIVEIILDRKGVRRWVAVDRDTRERLLRLSDRTQLVDQCAKLEWRIAADLGPKCHSPLVL